MFKIALTAGHYRYTAGKRCLKKLDPNETREWVLNDRIADKIEQHLNNYEGIEILRLDDTTGQKNIDLKERTSAANQFGADFYLSIHHNAGISGGEGGGIQAYVYTKASHKSLEWQKELYDALIKYTGLKGDRAIACPKANLHEVRETKMPAVLLELGFMDSKTDVPVILTEDFANKAAEACVEVIVRRAELTKRVIENNVKPETVQKYYRVAQEYNASKYVGQVGAFAMLTNAIAKATETKLDVFDWTGAKVWTYPKNPIKINKKVQEWQKAAIADGYEFPSGADGIWGKECEAVAKEAICRKPGKDKQYKNKNLTMFIQKELGFTGKSVDGLYGTDTKKKVVSFQNENKLVEDGICGYNTWKKILGV